jgi:hypothetical protein
MDNPIDTYGKTNALTQSSVFRRLIENGYKNEIEKN